VPLKGRSPSCFPATYGYTIFDGSTTLSNSFSVAKPSFSSVVFIY
jgi:hypothetical protein